MTAEVVRFKTSSLIKRGEADIVLGSGTARLSYSSLADPPAGAANTLLLVHGSGMSARSWTSQLRGLGRAARVLAIDLPGHGESDEVPEVTVDCYAEAARGFLKALGTGPAFVAGHSLGGAVALSLAARYPEAIRGLVLVSSCARLPHAGGSLGWLWWILPVPVWKVLFFWLAKKVLFAPRAPLGAVRAGMEEIWFCQPAVLLKDAGAAKAMDLEDAARSVRVPTLILCGGRDRLTPPALSQRLHELIAGSRLEIVDGAGHMLPLEAPERVNQSILAFMASVAPLGAPAPFPLGGETGLAILNRILGWLRGAFRRR